MANDSLLSLNKVLQGFDVTIKSATSKTVVYIVKAPDRTKLAADVNLALSRSKVKFKANVKDNVSSFPITTVTDNNTLYKVVYKPLKSGGSGAGAAATKLGESAQALYASMANVLGRDIKESDLTQVNFDKAIKNAITDEDFGKMKNELTDDWIYSSIQGANQLRKRYGSKNYEYHRGSKKVDIIESAFKKINKTEKAFGDINKWSPADIYIIKRGFNPSILNEESTLKGLNEMMYKLIEEEKLIGVSLKKIERGSGKISQKNFPKDAKISKASFKGTSSTFEAMDGYIIWGNASTEKIQFRSFGAGDGLTGWQGEIKGASANQGKISLGPLNYILKSHGQKQLPSSKESASLAKQNSDQHAKNIAKLMVDYKMISNSEFDAAVKTIQGKPEKYRYSKWLVLQLLIKMRDMNKKTADQITQDMYLYASSQASFSAPYLKLE
jgi:hypothetical protein|tara:strand:+ start:62 stop:1384 length:1323 start_codon:yes stop_codon:yes gene_type:complete